MSTSSTNPANAAPIWLAWARGLGKALAWLVGLTLAAALSLALLGALVLGLAYPQLPDISGLTDYRPRLPLRIYSSDHVLLGEFGEERRNFTPIKEIPPHVQNAVLAIEDARFFSHGGIDYKGVLRAAVANVMETRKQGASTITMQVARNFYLSSKRVWSRKIYEALLSLKIEQALSKEQILEVYMNQIYLGQRAYGFASASEIYFGKSIKDLSIAEAAMLAGLPQSPYANNPVSNLKRSVARQQLVIDRMLESGFITPEQHRAAKAERLSYRAQTDMPVHAEFAAETARQLVFSQYGEDAYTRGLNVFLTLKSDDQMVAYRALRRGIMDFERRQVYRGPEAHLDLPQQDSELEARVIEGLQEHPDNDEIKAAVVLSANPKQVVVMMQNGETLKITGEGLKPVASGLSPSATPNKQIRRGAVVRLVALEGSTWSLTQLPEVEGAFVAMEPGSGAVRALVGGFDFAKNKFNHVTQAWRQPGSSFKPFIYSAALEKGFTPSTVVNDAPLFYDAGSTGSQPWAPKNYDGTFEGPMSMRRALAKSKNMVSIRILESIGPHYAQEWVQRFGFEAAKHPAFLTMALGAGSVTPMQMASAYAVFANGGHRTEPRLIDRITDDKGHVLVESRPEPLSDARRTLDARNAFLTSSLLQEVARSGTAAKAQSTLKRPDLYGKTGTTNDSMDAWFAGFHPSLVAVVWMGYDTPRKLGSRETGGGLALPVWIDFMRHALKGVPVDTPQPPEGVVSINGEWYFEEFTPGTAINAVGLDEEPAPAPSEEEKRGILDLFKP